MRALIFDGERAGLATNHPDPTPAPGEAVIRTRQVGVSDVDLAICQGLMGFTGVLGHEFVGEVESVAGDDRLELIGKRVVGSITVVCGKCELCQAGLRAHCRQRTMLGMDGREGCLADRFTLPAQNLLPVPETVDDDHAVFAEPLAAAIQAKRQLTIEGKPYITILGDGPLGLLMAQVMSRLNASVRVVGRYSEKLAVCEKWQVKHRHVDDVGRRADQDIVVDCTGSPTGLELAMQLVRPRGKILLKTLLSPESRLALPADLTTLVLNEIELIGSSRGPLDEALTVIARREIDVVSLIDRRMNLDDGAAILQTAAKPGARKVLVAV